MLISGVKFHNFFKKIWESKVRQLQKILCSKSVAVRRNPKKHYFFHTHNLGVKMFSTSEGAYLPLRHLPHMPATPIFYPSTSDSTISIIFCWGWGWQEADFFFACPHTPSLQLFEFLSPSPPPCNSASWFLVFNQFATISIYKRTKI